MYHMTSMESHHFLLIKSTMLCINKTATYVDKVLRMALRITTKNSKMLPASKKNKAMWCMPMRSKENKEKRFQPKLRRVGCVADSYLLAGSMSLSRNALL